MISCSECGREVDEFIAASERWGYWSDAAISSRSVPRALHASSRPTLARAQKGLAFCVAMPVRRVLDLRSPLAGIGGESLDRAAIRRRQESRETREQLRAD